MIISGLNMKAHDNVGFHILDLWEVPSGFEPLWKLLQSSA